MSVTNRTNYTKYDAGTVSATTTYATVTPDETILQLLVYPLKAGFIKLNGSAKEIFLPAETWTPMSVATTSFDIKVAEDGDVYWQGWYL